MEVSSGNRKASCHGTLHCSTGPATENVSAQVRMQCRSSNAGVTRTLQSKQKIVWIYGDLCTQWIIFPYFNNEKNPFLETISLAFYNLSLAIGLNNIVWPPLQVSQMVNGVHGKSSD